MKPRVPPDWAPPMRGSIQAQIAECTQKRHETAALLERLEEERMAHPHKVKAARLLLGQCDAAITKLMRLEGEDGRGPYAEQA